MNAPRLENVLPREGINSSPEHPLKEFSWVVGSVAATVILVVLLVGWGAQWVAPHLPFSAEESLAARWIDQPVPQEQFVRTKALQTLADRIAAQLQLPVGMHVYVSVVDSREINAFASIGGRIRINRGLLERLNSEDSLAALLAHEIAHVKHRHVATSLGRGLALSLLLAAISADAGAATAQAAIGNATGLALLGYSRAQEAQADAEALRAVVAMYGHGAGFTALFTVLRDAQSDFFIHERKAGAELAHSHPLTADRIAAARARSRVQGWAMDGALTPLSKDIRWPMASSIQARARAIASAISAS